MLTSLSAAHQLPRSSELSVLSFTGIYPLVVDVDWVAELVDGGGEAFGADVAGDGPGPPIPVQRCSHAFG